MKACTRCGEVKPLEDYHRNNAAKDGRAYACRVCLNAQSKACRLAKIEHYRAVNRAWNARNKDRLAAYRETRKDKAREERAAWRARNRQHLREAERRRKAWNAFVKLGKSVAWIKERLGLSA